VPAVLRWRVARSPWRNEAKSKSVPSMIASVAGGRRRRQCPDRSRRLTDRDTTVDGCRRSMNDRVVPALAVSPTVPVRYLDEMVERSHATRDVAAACMRAAGLDPARPRSPVERITAERFTAAYKSLRDALDDEMFGFFARAVPPGAYATMARLLVGVRDLRTALGHSFRFYRLFDPHPYWQLAIAGDELRLAIHPRDDGQASSAVFLYTMLLAPLRFAAWLTGQELPIRRVVLDPRLRIQAADARSAFGVAPSWAAGAHLVALDASILELPVIRSDADAVAYPKDSLAALFSASARGTLEGDLRRVIAAAPSSIALAAAARSLELSPAALSRRLLAHGTSFQRVKDDVRRDRAVALLRSRRTSLADVADALGFAEPSAFHRAFKRWTGLTPIQYRATLL
jgi:AraC-like DNA-binding protein